jgi:hypothetical protein
MKLLDLDAEFIGNAQPKQCRRQGNQVEGAQGVMFQCPLCSVGLERGEEDVTRGIEGHQIVERRRFARGAHYVFVWFSNPRNAPPAPAECWPKPRWTFTGESLETLSLAPSIDIIDVDEQGNRKGTLCWHGFVTNGEAT